jgi:hypothetical protein
MADMSAIEIQILMTRNAPALILHGLLQKRAGLIGPTRRPSMVSAMQ